jgi:hypothetical protein
MSVEEAGAIEAPNPKTNPVIPEAITEPIAKASHQAYEQFAGRFEWYVEQWEDVVHEVRAVRAQKYSLEGVRVADVLSGLGGARVASSLPGRARLRRISLPNRLRTPWGRYRESTKPRRIL